MKQYLMMSILFFLILGCQTKSNQSQDNPSSLKVATIPTATITPDDLFNKPEQYSGKVISVEGLCVHTCKHSGKRMFLQGTDQTQLLLVVASEEISQFDQSLEGSTVLVTGQFSAITSNPEHDEHKSGEEACETESKSKNFQIKCLSFSKVD